MDLQNNNKRDRSNRNPDLPLPFNKYNNFKDIPHIMHRVTKNIDRIQLSVKNRMRVFSNVLSEFKLHFQSHGTMKDKGGKRFIYNFMYCDMRIELFYHNKKLKCPTFWFSISLHDPNEEVQMLVMNILNHVLGKDTLDIHKTQVEFATDFYPKRKKDIVRLHNAITHGLVLKNSRCKSYGIYSSEKSYRRFKATEYQGHEGNVRNGSRGLRCYFKEDLRCIRVELCAYRDFLKSKGIRSLPIRANDIDPFDHIQYRDGLNAITLRRLVDLIMKRSGAHRSIMAMRVKRRVIRNWIMRNIFIESTCFPEFNEWIMKPVAEQMSVFRELKKPFEITYSVGDFFPKRI